MPENNRKARNPSVRERVEKSGGLGISAANKRVLGSEARGPLGVLNRTILRTADIPVAALELAGHATEWLADEADRRWEGTAADKAVSRLTGVKQRPSEIIGGFPEAFPFGAPHGTSVPVGAALSRARIAAPKAVRVAKEISRDVEGSVPRSPKPTGGGALSTKRMKITHRTKVPNLDRVDPKMVGTNRGEYGGTFTNREEISKAKTATGGRSYFGVNTRQPGGYVDEKGAGPFEYEAEVDPSRYLFTDGDSPDLPVEYDRFLEQADAIREDQAALAALGLPPAAARSVVTERLIKDAGFDGIRYGPAWNNKYGSNLGEVLHHWGDPVPVRRVEQPIEGAPTKLGPYDPLRHSAREYTEGRGMEYSPPTSYKAIDEGNSTRLANAYDEMPHDPFDPDVAEAYDALKSETAAQLQDLQNRGYQFSFMDPENNPYPSPYDAIRDLRDNKRMQVYPTDAGFGGDEAFPNHPLLETIPDLLWGGKPVTYNDGFRAVHDAYGHAKEGFGFRAAGEDNAAFQHLPTFSPAAQRALLSETRGQNSLVNFGPHGEFNRTAGQGETIYAPQKAGLLPDEVAFAGTEDFMPDPRGTAYGFRGNAGGRGEARIRNDEGLKALLAERGTPYIPPSVKVPAAIRGQDGRPGVLYSNPSLISTRRPSQPNWAAQGNPNEELLIQTGQALRDAPEAYARNMNMAAEEPFMQGFKGTPEEIEAEGLRRMADNMKFIVNELMSPDLVYQSRDWYKKANEFAQAFAKKHGITTEAAAGVIAALSPQNHWANNVANADQIIDMFKRGFAPSSPDAGKRAAALSSKAIEAYKSGPMNALQQLGPEGAARIMNTPFEELTATERRHRVAIMSALDYDNNLFDLKPDGSTGELIGGVKWGSSNEVNSALDILNDPSVANIGQVLNGGGKVPTFYDNIIDPDAPLPLVTADTHHAGAASLFPGGGGDPFVYRTMGGSAPRAGGAPGAANSAKTGAKGLYGFVTDATALAGQELGMLPREVQSVVWEGSRNIWGSPKVKTPALKAAINEAWRSADNPEAGRRAVKGVLLERGLLKRQ